MEHLQCQPSAENLVTIEHIRSAKRDSRLTLDIAVVFEQEADAVNQAQSCSQMQQAPPLLLL